MSSYMKRNKNSFNLVSKAFTKNLRNMNTKLNGLYRVGQSLFMKTDYDVDMGTRSKDNLIIENILVDVDTSNVIIAEGDRYVFIGLEFYAQMQDYTYDMFLNEISSYSNSDFMEKAGLVKSVSWRNYEVVKGKEGEVKKLYQDAKNLVEHYFKQGRVPLVMVDKEFPDNPNRNLFPYFIVDKRKDHLYLDWCQDSTVNTYRKSRNQEILNSLVNRSSLDQTIRYALNFSFRQFMTLPKDFSKENRELRIFPAR